MFRYAFAAITPAAAGALRAASIPAATAALPAAAAAAAFAADARFDGARR